jgi:transcriptional regulator with XRE-family HTH domain
MGCDIDLRLGKRLRRRRQMVGLTQQELGAVVGLSCQQIQKYEYGSDRISAAGLWRLATALDAPVSYFFDGLGEDAAKPRASAPRQDEANGGGELLDLVGTYHGLSERKRRRIFAMARSLARDAELAGGLAEQRSA